MASKKVKSKQKPEAKSQKTGKATRKVWYITDFRELFKLTDDVRKKHPGPLSYTKSQVTLSGLSKGGEIRHFEMMKILKSRSERHLLRSVFEDLKNWTAGKHYGPRGYLVTTEDKPASYEYLAAQLQINTDDLKQSMPILAKIGLIERVSLNVLLDGAGPSRTHPDTPGSKHRPLKNGKAKGNSKTKTKGKGKSKSKANEQGASKRQSGVTARAKENGNSAKRKAITQEKDQAAGQGQSKGQGQEEPPTTPTTTPPFKPLESDDLGGSHVIPFTAPQTSLKPASGRQHPAVAAVAGGYDRNDEVFGARVYVALGLRWDTGSPEGRREICCFASKWAQARVSLARLPPEVVDGLGVRLIKEAGIIARRGKRNKRPGAVWCTVVDKLVRARLRETM